MKVGRSRRAEYRVSDITPDDIPGLWYYCVCVEGMVLIRQSHNGQNEYLTFRSQAGAHSARARATVEYPEAEVVAK